MKCSKCGRAVKEGHGTNIGLSGTPEKILADLELIRRGEMCMTCIFCSKTFCNNCFVKHERTHDLTPAVIRPGDITPDLKCPRCHTLNFASSKSCSKCEYVFGVTGVIERFAATIAAVIFWFVVGVLLLRFLLSRDPHGWPL